MRKKSPQEKKRLSLLKDRRNTYGEHSKGSRKRIARRKRERSRVERRLRNQPLRRAVGQVDSDIEERVEIQRVAARDWRWKSTWQKSPDEPLGEVLAEKLTRRARLGIMSQKGADAVKAKIRRRTKR
jgi:hypothetical protein